MCFPALNIIYIVFILSQFADILLLLKFLVELPKNARLLMDCEAAEILHEIEEHKTILSEDPKVKFPE